MNEVFRVLRPGGVLYAVTPAYPVPEAFQDPTHVNIITERTHLYFAGDQPMARMYGYIGNFDVRRAHWARHKDALVYAAPPSALWAVRQWNYRRKGAFTHFVWDLTCVK